MTARNPYLNVDAELFQVSVWGRGGRIPTFVLNSQIQGILDSEHAAQIALGMFEDCRSVTVMSYRTGEPISFERCTSCDVHFDGDVRRTA